MSFVAQLLKLLQSIIMVSICLLNARSFRENHLRKTLRGKEKGQQVQHDWSRGVSWRRGRLRGRENRFHLETESKYATFWLPHFIKKTNCEKTYNFQKFLGQNLKYICQVLKNFFFKNEPKNHCSEHQTHLPINKLVDHSNNTRHHQKDVFFSSCVNLSHSLLGSRS